MQPRPEDLARYAPRRAQRRVSWSRSPVVRCDDMVDIADVLTDHLGCAAPHGVVGSYKIRCPFGSEHPDGGIDMGFRIYASNTAYCFVMHGTHRPSTLIAYARGWSRTRSALWLLDRYGLAVRVPYRQRYNEVAVWVADRSMPAGSTQELAAALQREMAERPEYQAAEYEEAVRGAWRDVLETLDMLVARGAADYTHLSRWYQVARGRLTAALTAVKQSGTVE